MITIIMITIITVLQLIGILVLTALQYRIYVHALMIENNIVMGFHTEYGFIKKWCQVNKLTIFITEANALDARILSFIAWLAT